MTTIADEKYVALTTYKKDGSEKTLPVWIADFGEGTIGFTTSSSSYKVKRIANDSRVAIQPSDSRGNVRGGSARDTGTAVDAVGSEYEKNEAIVKSQYGIQYRAIKLLGSFMKLIGRGSGTDAAVIITPDA